MTASTNNSQTQNQVSDKEMNFRALEQKLAKETAARIEAENALSIAKQSKIDDEDDDTSEPYVDHKKLNKKLAKHAAQTQQNTQEQINYAVNVALKEHKKNEWLQKNPDFFDVLQNAEKFKEIDPELAESILQMPEGFERQRLVYKSIKAIGLHKESTREPTIQEKIDANRRTPYYQPSGIGSSAYASQSDYSEVGQKQAYEKLQQLKNNLRL